MTSMRNDIQTAYIAAAYGVRMRRLTVLLAL
jgi:hypothetical protein